MDRRDHDRDEERKLGIERTKPGGPQTQDGPPGGPAPPPPPSNDEPGGP